MDQSDWADTEMGASSSQERTSHPAKLLPVDSPTGQGRIVFSMIFLMLLAIIYAGFLLRDLDSRNLLLAEHERSTAQAAKLDYNPVSGVYNHEQFSASMCDMKLIFMLVRVARVTFCDEVLFLITVLVIMWKCKGEGVAIEMENFMVQMYTAVLSVVNPTIRRKMIISVGSFQKCAKLTYCSIMARLSDATTHSAETQEMDKISHVVQHQESPKGYVQELRQRLLPATGEIEDSTEMLWERFNSTEDPRKRNRNNFFEALSNIDTDLQDFSEKVNAIEVEKILSETGITAFQKAEEFITDQSLKLEMMKQNMSDTNAIIAAVQQFCNIKGVFRIYSQPRKLRLLQLDPELKELIIILYCNSQRHLQSLSRRMSDPKYGAKNLTMDEFLDVLSDDISNATHVLQSKHYESSPSSLGLEASNMQQQARGRKVESRTKMKLKAKHRRTYMYLRMESPILEPDEHVLKHQGYKSLSILYKASGYSGSDSESSGETHGYGRRRRPQHTKRKQRLYEDQRGDSD